MQHDILAIAAKNPTCTWGWYQQGYGPEPFDGTAISENGAPFSGSPFKYAAAPEHASYIVHHNGPQYFGYIGDNTQEQAYLHGLQQFYTDVASEKLPEDGGVFYVRGGYYNNDGLLPVDPNPNVKLSTPGNDDHPNYSDAQISEALIADSVNAIAHSRYWRESVIIIAYDESDGLYDHQPESFRTYGPDGQPETGGPRIPAIVISPFAAAHTVSHVYSEHSSVIQFINELFGLIPLADLPDEAGAAAAGASNPALNGPNGPQTNLGPADALAGMGDLLEAFDDDRLTGEAPPLPRHYATIDREAVTSLPHYGGSGCSGAPHHADGLPQRRTARPAAAGLQSAAGAEPGQPVPQHQQQHRRRVDRPLGRTDRRAGFPRRTARAPRRRRPGTASRRTATAVASGGPAARAAVRRAGRRRRDGGSRTVGRQRALRRRRDTGGLEQDGPARAAGGARHRDLQGGSNTYS